MFNHKYFIYQTCNPEQSFKFKVLQTTNQCDVINMFYDYMKNENKELCKEYVEFVLSKKYLLLDNLKILLKSIIDMNIHISKNTIQETIILQELDDEIVDMLLTIVVTFNHNINIDYINMFITTNNDDKMKYWNQFKERYKIIN
jgi:hypothetical protein